MKLKIEIKNRWTGKVIFEFETENNNIAKTINEYVRIARADLTSADLTSADLTSADLTRADLINANLTRANLTGANLINANLTDANLTGADLTRADLTRANLTDANLINANLTDANLTGADLTRADLTDASLTDANLTRADLTDANLTRANLINANLINANLTDANLTRADLINANLLKYKSDLWRVLLMNKNEIAGLREALVNGKVNGSAYEGECACLKGTIANVKGCEIEAIPGMTKNVAEPAEQWFLQIKEGHTPDNNGVVKKTVEWIDNFLQYMNA